MNEKLIRDGMRTILQGLGHARLTQEVIDNTPDRVARMYGELFAHIDEDPADVLRVTFQENYNEMVAARGIPFHSMCEHHFLPFIGTADVVYIPKGGRIVGASKLARAVDVAASRPQLQERLTSQIADALMERLDPFGVLVRLRATHLCMTLRGARKPGSTLVTSALRGIFHTEAASRAEGLALIS